MFNILVWNTLDDNITVKHQEFLYRFRRPKNQKFDKPTFRSTKSQSEVDQIPTT